MKLKFPQNFWWGSATSGAQCESAQLVDGKSENIWDHWYGLENSRFFEQKNCVNDFYTKYKGDIKIAKDLNFNSLRIGMQWSRLIPDGININKKAVEFYNNVINEMVKNKIEPVVTLMHFDMPMWAMEIGGLENRKVAEAFASYAKVAFELFGDRVKHWVTHNEPGVPVECGYLYDCHWPKIVDFKKSMTAQYHTMISHFLVVKEFRKLKIKDGKIGIVCAIQPSIPRSNSKADLEAAKLADIFQWRSYTDPAIKGQYPKELLDLLKKHKLLPEVMKKMSADLKLMKENPIDFLGVNYYNPQRIKALDYIPNFNVETVTPHTHFYAIYDMAGKRMNPYRGWEIYPKTLYKILKFVKEEYNNIPCYISENGMGVQDEGRFRKSGIIQDDYRIDFFKEHLYWVHKAISEGVNCFGFHMWTYIDNWSWSNAYKNRYGYYELDLKTGKRIPKKSAAWIKVVIKNNTIDLDESIVLDK